jgi:hypothetical protein
MLHLSIAFWMSWRGVGNLDAQIFTVPLEGTTSKLGPIVSDDPVWDPKSDDWGCFRPLGELVDVNIQESVSSDGVGKWPHDVQPPQSEGP